MVFARCAKYVIIRTVHLESIDMRDCWNREINYLRLSVTDKCNLRCRYCMPEEGVCKKRHEDMMTEEEMVMAVEAASSLGISKVRITGGEPLVKKNILSVCEKVSHIHGIREVSMTTNGILLPEMADSLRKAGVRRINISLDTLIPEKYTYITRRKMQEKALEGLMAALDAGFEKVKLNVVLIGGFNEVEIPELAQLTKKYPVDVRFIELMPMYDSGDFGPEAMISCDKVLEYLPDAKPSGKQEGVAKLYRLPDALGNVGLISPVSNHFCGQCNRIRLTADGKLKPCLHSSNEISIKGADYETMVKLFEKAILEKPAAHPFLSSANRSDAGRNMNQIGG